MKLWPFSKKEKPKARAYAAAAHNRFVSSWMANATSVDAEIRSSFPALRNRARQLARDNDYVRSFLRVVQNNVVGKGIGFQSHIEGLDGKPDKALNNLIESEWKRWTRKDSCHAGGRLNFCDIERMVMRSVPESGEIYARLVKQKFGDSKVPLALQLFEGDQVCDDMNGTADNGNSIRMGVEQDQEFGRVVAYWIRPHHPGDYKASISPIKIRIPAEEIIPLFIHERPGQNRGVTWMASSILRLHHMYGLEEATILRARTVASIMGFIENAEGETSGDAVDGADRVTEFEPGTFKYLGPGESMKISDVNSPSGELDPFMRSMIRGVAAGCGSSYESISKDYSQSNFSSTRQALIEDRDNWKILQQWLINNFHQRVFETWLDMAVLSGAIPIKGYEKSPEKYQNVQWMPRGWQWIDPLKDVNANKEAIKAGLDSISNVLAQSGLDFENVMQQRSREKEYAESLGLSFDVDEPQINNQNSISGLQNPKPDPEETDPSDNVTDETAQSEVDS